MIGLSTCEQRVEVAVGQTVRVFRAGLQLEEVNDVDEADLQVGELFTQQRGRRQRFLRGNVARACHHYIGFASLIVARPVPDADALRAVRDRGIHVQVLQVQLLVGNDHVDVVLAAQTVIGNRQEPVHIRRQIDARYFGSLVHDDVEEARILVRKAVVILTPDGGGDQQVERGDRFAATTVDCRSTATSRAD